jgi:dipeptidyl-peptidase-4
MTMNHFLHPVNRSDPWRLTEVSAIFTAVLLTLVFLPMATFAQTEDASRLSLERIFSSDEFEPQRFGGFKWLIAGDAYAKLEPSPTAKGKLDLVRYTLPSGQRDVLVTAERLKPVGATDPLLIQDYEWSADGQKLLVYTNSKKVWRLNTRGDYWVLDLPTGKLTQIGAGAQPSTLMFAKFSPDGKRVGYVMANDIYVQDIGNSKTYRLTKDGSHTLINGTSDWVNEEEFALRDCWRWSPDSKSIAFWQFNAEGIQDFLLVNDTIGLYPSLTRIPYPKTGTVNSAVRIGVINARGGKTRWLNTPGDPRNTYLVSVDWTSDSSELVLQHLNRLQNTLQLLSANPQTGAVHSVLTETDDAWVDVYLPAMHWLDSGRRFLWVSERDGWRHAYSVAKDGTDQKLITSGAFDAISIAGVDEPGGWLYYIASPDNATQRYLYRSRLDGTGSPERIASPTAKNWNAYNLSPTGRWTLQTSSSFGTPPSYTLIDLSNPAAAKTSLDNNELRAKLDKLKQGTHEFLRVDIGNGVVLDGWMMKPPDFDPAKKYPVLFYVYGEPAGQLSNDSWSGANYLWDLMLTQQGYIVACVDNRGTPEPRGRVWRKSIYRKIGTLNSQDQAAAVKAIEATMPFVDPTRIGIWGWSGGGGSTLNAMFRYPDIYRMGMAVAPATDNHYYDTIYTERYMGMPQDNVEDYRQSAPNNFVNGLKGDLLIVHGTGDDNVHYQGTELLLNQLIAANKPFTIMAYPNRTHSISEGDGTTRHLYELLTRYLHEHLPVN